MLICHIIMHFMYKFDVHIPKTFNNDLRAAKLQNVTPNLPSLLGPVRPKNVVKKLSMLSWNKNLQQLVTCNRIILEIRVIRSKEMHFISKFIPKHCATTRKVAGSIPDGVTGIVH